MLLKFWAKIHLRKNSRRIEIQLIAPRFYKQLEGNGFPVSVASLLLDVV